MSYSGTWWRSGDGNKRDVTTGCYLVSPPTPAHSSDLPVWRPAERGARGGTPGRGEGEKFERRAATVTAILRCTGPERSRDRVLLY